MGASAVLKPYELLGILLVAFVGLQLNNTTDVAFVPPFFSPAETSVGGNQSTLEDDLDPAFKPKRSIRQLIMAQGFPYAKHAVVTDDGYILSLHRLPNPGKPPVLILHGVLDSAITWVAMDRNHSLPFLLHKAGFDVWLGNCRGASPTDGHLHLSYSDPEFWDFNTDDVIAKDFPVLVNRVFNETGNSQISFLGHSQGSLLGFTSFTSQNHEIARKISAFVALAPVASFDKNPSWLDSVVPAPQTIVEMAGSLSVMIAPRVFVFNAVRNYIIQPVCSVVPWFCVPFLCASAGCSLENWVSLADGAWAMADLQRVFQSYPQEGSFGQVAQFAQWETSRKIAKFDYGAERNLAKYGTSTPPVYNVTDLSVPVAVFYGGHDTIIPPERAEAGIRALPSDKVKMVKKVTHYGHAEFVWGRESARTVYPDIIQFFREHG